MQTSWPAQLSNANHDEAWAAMVGDVILNYGSADVGYDDDTFLSEMEDDSDTQTMPDLQSVSDSELSCGDKEDSGDDSGEDRVTWVQPDGGDEGMHADRIVFDPEDVEWEELQKWTGIREDLGHDAFTHAFNLAMLANVHASSSDASTELYDSGASRHISPYHHHFVNYTSIVPKPITAADKCMFNAIDKGDMEIDVPIGDGKSKTILL